MGFLSCKACLQYLQTLRACTCLHVSTWPPFKTRVQEGLATRPHSSGYLVLRAVVHMMAERGMLLRLTTFQPSLSAPDGRYSLLPASSILPLPIGCSALQAFQTPAATAPPVFLMKLQDKYSLSLWCHVFKSLLSCRAHDDAH